MILRWTRQAIADLDAAYDFVVSDDPAAARRIIDRIEEAASILRRHSSAGGLGRVRATRELVITGTPFILAYRVRKGAVEVLAIVHGSRKWPESF